MSEASYRILVSDLGYQKYSDTLEKLQIHSQTVVPIGKVCHSLSRHGRADDRGGQYGDYRQGNMVERVEHVYRGVLAQREVDWAKFFQELTPKIWPRHRN